MEVRLRGYARTRPRHPVPRPLRPAGPDRRVQPQEAIYGDDRLPSNTLVVGVEIEGVYKGYPIAQLEEAGSVINDTVGGQPIAVFLPCHGW